MPTEGGSPSSLGSEYVRLHITPFDPELSTKILSASAQESACNISYHSIETFPEKRYGFVDLPTMEAEKIKKKFNGSVLKGAKVRVEKARPDVREEPTGEVDDVEETTKDKKRKKKAKSEDEDGTTKKRKRDRDVVKGVAIKDRKVKRGWTEPVEYKKKSKKDKDKEKDGSKTEKKKRLKSKYTEQEECLLKTKVPLNAMSNIAEDNLPKKRKKRGNAREIIVHEFEKTTKFPSFLKSDASGIDGKPTTEFVEGKGWVDEDGNVVETVKEKPARALLPKKEKTSKKQPPVQPAKVEDSSDDATSSSGTSSSGEDSESESESESEAVKEQSETKKNDSPEPVLHATPPKPDDARPVSSSSSKSLTIKIPPPETPSATKVHPLEALYKRSKPSDDVTETPVQTQSFSFFGGGGDDVDEDMEDGGTPIPGPTAPMTPYTRQDFELRLTRSAAPTPDTAHPSRVHNFWPPYGNDEGEEEEDEEQLYEDDKQQQQGQPAGLTSDFQSWFWENRRELNQSWMKRRKTAAKEKRHRENKARASRAV